jgi:hypothetical protein
MYIFKIFGKGTPFHMHVDVNQKMKRKPASFETVKIVFQNSKEDKKSDNMLIILKANSQKKIYSKMNVFETEK